jgi:hypothetical protein
MGGWSQGKAIDERVGVMPTLTKLFLRRRQS